MAQIFHFELYQKNALQFRETRAGVSEAGKLGKTSEGRGSSEGSDSKKPRRLSRLRKTNAQKGKVLSIQFYRLKKRLRDYGIECKETVPGKCKIIRRLQR